MKVAAWLDVATWRAVVEAARERPEEDEVVLLAIDDQQQLDLLLGGLIGRGRRREPVGYSGSVTRAGAESLLAEAAETFGRPCEQRVLSGSVERAVTQVAAEVELLIVARDGDRSRLGPHSLGPHTRFVIDHAPCTVELIWPESPPGLATVPGPPGRR